MKFKIKESISYSLNEKKVGKWVDKKPIFKKTITVENIETNTYSFNIQNFKELVKPAEFLCGNGNDFAPYFYLRYEGSNEVIRQVSLQYAGDGEFEVTAHKFERNLNTNNIIYSENEQIGNLKITLFYTKDCY